MLGKTATRHTSAEFVALLTDIAAKQPRRKDFHAITDNLRAHKTKPLDTFLAKPPRIHMQFTPTC